MSTELPPMPRFVSDEHDARYEFSVPRTTYEDLRDEYVDLRARLQEEIAKREMAERDYAACRELLSIHNLGGMTDYNDGPMKRALAAESRLQEAEKRLAIGQTNCYLHREHGGENGMPCKALRESESRAAALQKELEAVREQASLAEEDSDRLSWVERHLCRAGEVRDERGNLTGIMKCWQIVTQCDDPLRETIDTLRAALSKESK
jgi:hypothetical protein